MPGCRSNSRCSTEGMGCPVLVVDDDLDIRDAMADALETAGYPVVAADNGEAALARMREQKPCVVVLDLMMPVLDGWQLVERMREDPELKDIPICVLSAMASQPPPGMQCVLGKPVQLLRLLTAVRRYCDC